MQNEPIRNKEIRVIIKWGSHQESAAKCDHQKAGQLQYLHEKPDEARHITQEAQLGQSLVLSDKERKKERDI